MSTVELAQAAKNEGFYELEPHEEAEAESEEVEEVGEVREQFDEFTGP